MKYAVMAINMTDLQVVVPVATIFLTIGTHKSAVMVPFNQRPTIDVGVVAAHHTTIIQVSAAMIITMKF